MTCEEAVHKLHEYLDHELDHVTADQVERHLEICKTCCDHMEFEKHMKKLVHQCCCEQKAPTFLREKIIDKLSFGGQ
jgi:anti-sigma factor (TIGR02949 family)